MKWTPDGITFFVILIFAIVWLVLGTLWFYVRESKTYSKRTATMLKEIGRKQPEKKKCFLIRFFHSLFRRKNKEKQSGQDCDSDFSCGFELPQEISNVLNRLIDREHVYIMNWVSYQMISKVSGLASLSFSIVGVASTYSEAPKWQTITFGLLSIIFVSIILYLSPPRRVQQYLLAWQNVDKKYGAALANFGKYDQWNASRKKAIEDNNQEELKKINEEISQAVCEIAKAIEESEQILTSEGE